MHQTVEDKTGTEISNEEEEEEENDVQFTYVACGATHTVLATHHGHMCLAFGNHKFGQLGIAERSVKPKVDICDECSTLQAFFECAECPSKEERDDETNQIEYRNIRFCESCWAVIHKQKKNRLHSQIRMKPTDKRRFRTNPVPVKTHECEKGDDQETDDMVGVGIGMESEVTNNTDSQYWPVVDLYNVTQIACGDSHTMAIVSSLRDGPGEVYSWGNGSSGRTGLTDIDNSPDTRDQFEACLIESQETVQDEESVTASRAATERVEYQPLEARRIAAGGQHSLALTHDEETGTGCVLSWGSNEFGQLGRPIEDNHGRWTTIFDVVSFSNGDTYKIDLIACGDLHCLAVSKFGQGLSQLYSWGCAKNGRLGFECDGEFEPAPRPVGPPSKDRYVSISAGVCHSAALTRRKFLYCWGLNESGQCGFFNWGDTCRSCSIKPSKEYCCGPMTPKQLEEHIYHATTPNEDGIQSKDTKEYKDKTASKDVLKPTYVPFPADKAKKPTSVAIKSGSTPRTPVSGAKSGATPRLEEDDEGVLQVACGEQHTLALVGKNLWLLGSGLDQQYRRENMKIEKAPPGAKGLRDKIVYSKGFYPRTIELAFSDTAEITTKPAKTFDGDIQLNKEDDPGDAVRYTLTAIEVSIYGRACWSARMYV
jgi:alpha-tubulin suppressor-like RCC1 family protein